MFTRNGPDHSLFLAEILFFHVIVVASLFFQGPGLQNSKTARSHPNSDPAMLIGLGDELASAIIATPVPAGADADKHRASLISTVAAIVSAAVPAGALSTAQANTLAGLGSHVAFAAAATVTKASALGITIGRMRSTFNVAEYLEV